jgi:hypothetical protein
MAKIEYMKKRKQYLRKKIEFLRQSLKKLVNYILLNKILYYIFILKENIHKNNNIPSNNNIR